MLNKWLLIVFTILICLIFTYLVIYYNADRKIDTFAYFLPWVMVLCAAWGRRKELKGPPAKVSAEKPKAENRWPVRLLRLVCLGLSILFSCYLFWHIVFFSERGWGPVALNLVAALGMWVTYFLLRPHIALRKWRL
jgi:hypothetical protein